MVGWCDVSFIDVKNSCHSPQYGRTPLMFAAKSDKKEMLELLRSRGWVFSSTLSYIHIAHPARLALCM